MTALLACTLLAIVAYALYARRRHTRLKADCVAAFERTYAATTPRPSFDMGYSYGEPVFQLKFASRPDMLAAAVANAAFLRAIDDLCKDRGHKRQFRAERAVFFQHPSIDEATVTHCCAAMRAEVSRTIAYSAEARAYGLRTSKVGTPAVPISHCPWCGTALPPTSSGT